MTNFRELDKAQYSEAARRWHRAVQLLSADCLRPAWQCFGLEMDSDLRELVSASAKTAYLDLQAGSDDYFVADLSPANLGCVIEKMFASLEVVRADLPNKILHWLENVCWDDNRSQVAFDVTSIASRLASGRLSAANASRATVESLVQLVYARVVASECASIVDVEGSSEWDLALLNLTDDPSFLFDFVFNLTRCIDLCRSLPEILTIINQESALQAIFAHVDLDVLAEIRP